MSHWSEILAVKYENLPLIAASQFVYIVLWFCSEYELICGPRSVENKGMIHLGH